MSFWLSYSSSRSLSAHQIPGSCIYTSSSRRGSLHRITALQRLQCTRHEALTRSNLTAKPTCSGHTAGSKTISSKIPLCGVFDSRLEMCDRVGLWGAMKPTYRVSRPSANLIRITPTEHHKVVPLAADGVELISERPCRYQVVRRFGGAPWNALRCGIFSESLNSST